MSDLVADTVTTEETRDRTAFETGFKFKIKLDDEVGIFYVRYATDVGPFMRQMYPHNKLISVKNLEKFYEQV